MSCERRFADTLESALGLPAGAPLLFVARFGRLAKLESSGEPVARWNGPASGSRFVNWDRLARHFAANLL
jgi:hypothetical protein